MADTPNRGYPLVEAEENAAEVSVPKLVLFAEKVDLDVHGILTTLAGIPGEIEAVDDSLTAHVAASDPHPGYLKESDVDTDVSLAANSNTKVPSQSAIKAYVDNLITGISWKTAVRAATTANVTLSSGLENGDVIDGVTLATGDRILVKNQTSSQQNGIYVVNASGAPTRAPDANTSSELAGATVSVREGTVNADTQWTCTNNSAITIDTTAVTFAQISGAGTYSATGGITLAGNQFSLSATLDFSAKTVNGGVYNDATLNDALLAAYSEYMVSNAASTGSVALDLSSSNVFNCTLTGNVTFVFNNPPATGRAFSFTIITKQDATGGRSITWPASKKFAGGVTPPPTTTANAVDIWTVYTYDGGSTYIVSLAVKDAK